MKRTIIVCTALLVIALPAYPWGHEGHQAIAKVSYGRLSATAKQHVDAILAGEDIADAAAWPDDIRRGAHPGKLANTAEGKDFNKRFKSNGQWHYVNLPLGTKRYTLSGSFSSADDVVHALRTCIDVLQGKSTVMSEKEALRWIIHLVGDIHQPLHVGTGYFSFDNDDQAYLITDPAEVSNHPSDVGGNILYHKSEKFHAYWDTYLVEHVGKQTHTSLETVLNDRIDQGHYSNSGSIRSWPAKWATASVHVAAKAYKDLEFGPREKPDHPTSADSWIIHIEFPDGYQAKQLDTATDQLARAAYNLSALLNAIHWKN